LISKINTARLFGVFGAVLNNSYLSDFIGYTGFSFIRIAGNKLMNCKKCGAPMVLYRERDYYHCEHCDSYHFPYESIEGMRVLGENPEGIKCPQCRTTLNMATIDNYYRGYRCTNCRGLLFDRTRFREVIDDRRSRTQTPPEPVNTFDPAELTRKTDCPICHKGMETFKYHGPGNIVIDTCHQDDLIWLDYGELNKVVNAPGRDRGVPRIKPEEEETEDQNQSKENKTFLDQFLQDIFGSIFNNR
jgi:Zn-finger nucleic acid-binding protein